jgi:hypothetical protein
MNPGSVRSRAGIGTATACGLALALATWGCQRPPQVAVHNREIVVALATAVSARNNEWLEANARLIEQRRTEKQLSDAEYASLKAIVARARAGDWKSAEEAVYALRDAQEPTPEDLRNLAARKLAPEHQLSKGVLKKAPPPTGRRSP